MHPARSFLVLLLLLLITAGWSSADPVGTQGVVGTLESPTVVHRLEITKPGVYENFLVDAGGKGGNTVKISCDDVTLRNCEIRNGTGNGIGVFGTRVVIEHCRIHHMLNGTFEDQKDAHGITGRWGDVTIRNCDIAFTSGDSIQFDPDRTSRGRVVIENCHLRTGPLPGDALGFKAGQRPGENAMDTKTMPDGDRCQLIMRNCLLNGWNQPAQIDNMAALNLKEHVHAEVTRCIFFDNEIAFRVRGSGNRGGAHVSISDCVIDDTRVGVRAEDGIENLTIHRLGFGPGVETRMKTHNGRELPGFVSTGEYEAPSIGVLLKSGIPGK